jgi:RimJ/RimL family protein N-acetyltransferase
MQTVQRVNVVCPPMDVELADQDVLLRPYRPEHLDELFVAARESVEEVGRWLPWCHPDYTREESTAWIESRPQAWRDGVEYSFAIIDRSSGRFMGGCGLNQFDYERQRSNLGYWIRTSATRNGYGTAAARLLARWGVESLHLERMEIVAAVGNIASQRVAVKAGAMREGIARSRVRIRGVQHNAVIFSLVRSDIVGGPCLNSAEAYCPSPVPSTGSLA